MSTLAITVEILPRQGFLQYADIAVARDRPLQIGHRPIGVGGIVDLQEQQVVWIIPKGLEEGLNRGCRVLPDVA